MAHASKQPDEIFLRPDLVAHLRERAETLRSPQYAEMVELWARSLATSAAETAVLGELQELADTDGWEWNGDI